MLYPTESQRSAIILLITQEFGIKQKYIEVALGLFKENNHTSSLKRIKLDDFKIDFEFLETDDNKRIAEFIDAVEFLIYYYKRDIRSIESFGKVFIHRDKQKFHNAKFLYNKVVFEKDAFDQRRWGD